MKYDVKIDENELGHLMINVPSEIFLVANLLLSDVQERKSGLRLKLINRVLSKKSSYEEITGNVCTMEIKYDVTKIVFEYAWEGELDHCFIETDELKKIFMLWDEAIERKYRASN